MTEDFEDEEDTIVDAVPELREDEEDTAVVVLEDPEVRRRRVTTLPYGFPQTRVILTLP